MAEEKGLVERIPQMIPGALLILIIMAALKGVKTDIISFKGVEGYLAGQTVFGIKDFFVRVLHLNYVLLTIIVGMLLRNVVWRGKIPDLFKEGFNLSRLLLKTGIVLLGSLYTLQTLARLGGLAVTLIVFFVFFSVAMVWVLGKMWKVDRSMTGVLSGACGICGVSTAIACAPVCKARSSEVAYAIATILGFGIVTMFISPAIGTALGMTQLQFGAWMGTGLLNSGQVLAASLAYTPGGVPAPGTAVAYGEVWNVVRVVMIPAVVFVIAIWYSSGAGEGEAKISFGQLLKEKFPLFVLGFVGMVVLTTIGAFGATGAIPPEKPSATITALRNMMVWFFGLGLVGLGAFIDLREISRAGGTPLKIGLLTGFTKWVLSLVVIMLLVKG